MQVLTFVIFAVSQFVAIKSNRYLRYFKGTFFFYGHVHILCKISVKKQTGLVLFLFLEMTIPGYLYGGKHLL